MVASDHEHVRSDIEERRDMRVERFEQRDLAVEIAVLAGAVGPLVVDEEEIVLGAVLS